MNDSIAFKHYQNLIDGKWVDSNCDDRIDLLDPAIEVQIRTIPVGTAVDVDRTVEAVQTPDEISNTKSVYFDRTGLVRNSCYNLLCTG